MSLTTAKKSARWRARQYHPLSSESHIHPFLVALWDEVREQSGGRLDVAVHPANTGLVRPPIGIVQQLIDGEIEFCVLADDVLSPLVPAMAAQSLPFVFSTAAQAHAAFDGPLGDWLRDELHAQGVVALPGGLMENGFRHICTREQAVRTVEDLAELRIRVASGRLSEELFRTLGASPAPLHLLDLYRALEEGRVDGHENLLSVIESLRLHEVTRHVSLTSHRWSGFNLLAGRTFWERLPKDVREIVLASVRRHVVRQREHTEGMNRALETALAQRNMRILRPARDDFRACLLGGDFYREWREIIGRKAWALLEQNVGNIA